MKGVEILGLRAESRQRGIELTRSESRHQRARGGPPGVTSAPTAVRNRELNVLGIGDQSNGRVAPTSPRAKLLLCRRSQDEVQLGESLGQGPFPEAMAPQFFCPRPSGLTSRKTTSRSLVRHLTAIGARWLAAGLSVVESDARGHPIVQEIYSAARATLWAKRVAACRQRTVNPENCVRAARNSSLEGEWLELVPVALIRRAFTRAANGFKAAP